MKPEQTVTKTEFAYQLLRQEILECRLEPGTQLRLGEMRQQYDLGWTPLREALTRLEGDRLVVSKSNRGFSVADVTLSELQDLSRTRLVLELALLNDSVKNGDSDWEEAVAAAHFRLNRCKLLSSEALPVINPSAENFTEWEDRHQKFHLALLGAAQSEWQKRFYLDITMHMHRHLRYLMGHPGYVRSAKGPDGAPENADVFRARVIDSHTELMNAAIDRNLERLTELVVDHVQFSNEEFSAFEGGKSDKS